MPPTAEGEGGHRFENDVERKWKLLSRMRNENIYCEIACCDLRSLRNSDDSHRVQKLPVVLFLLVREMTMERVGQSGLENLFMITKDAEGGSYEASAVALGIWCSVCLVSCLFLFSFLSLHL